MGTVWRATVQNTNKMGSSHMNTSQCYNDVAEFAHSHYVVCLLCDKSVEFYSPVHLSSTRLFYIFHD